MSLEVTKKHVSAIAKSMDVPGLSYLQKVDLIARAIGYTNQATLMAAFNADTPSPAPAQGREPEMDVTLFPVLHSGLTPLETAAMHPYRNDLREMSLAQLREEHEKAQSESDEATAWAEAILAHNKKRAGKKLTDAEMGAIAEFKGDLKAFTANKLQQELSDAQNVIAQEEPWAEATAVRIRDLELQMSVVARERNPYRAVITSGREFGEAVMAGAPVPEGAPRMTREAGFGSPEELSAYLQGVREHEGDLTVVAVFSGVPGQDLNADFFVRRREEPSLTFRDWYAGITGEPGPDPELF